MLKLGIKDIQYLDFALDERKNFEKAKLHGFDGLDFGAFTSASSEFLNLHLNEYEKRLTSYQKQASEFDIEFHQAHGLWWINDSNLEERKSNVALYKKQIMGTSFLGCKNLVIHPFCAGGWELENLCEAKKTFDGNIEVLEELLPTAREFGVTLCLENLPFPRFSHAFTHTVKQLIEAVNDEHVKACLDTGHANVMKEDSYTAVKNLGKDLRCLHIHDNYGDTDAHNHPFDGTFDWKGFTKALKEINYSGYLSYEVGVSKELPEQERAEKLISLANILKDFAKEIEN